jgi:hypothetical protein
MDVGDSSGGRLRSMREPDAPSLRSPRDGASLGQEAAHRLACIINNRRQP